MFRNMNYFDIKTIIHFSDEKRSEEFHERKCAAFSRDAIWIGKSKRSMFIVSQPYFLLTYMI